jgi:hypothetical protein
VVLTCTLDFMHTYQLILINERLCNRYPRRIVLWLCYTTPISSELLFISTVSHKGCYSSWLVTNRKTGTASKDQNNECSADNFGNNVGVETYTTHDKCTDFGNYLCVLIIQYRYGSNSTCMCPHLMLVYSCSYVSIYVSSYFDTI